MLLFSNSQRFACDTLSRKTPGCTPKSPTTSLFSRYPTFLNPSPPLPPKMRGSLTLAVGLFTLFISALASQQPEQIYGVNLGSWYVLESPFVLERSVTDPPQAVVGTLDAPRRSVIHRFADLQHQKLTDDSQIEWVSMGGEICSNCQDCIASELCVNSITASSQQLTARTNQQCPHPEVPEHCRQDLR